MMDDFSDTLKLPAGIYSDHETDHSRDNHRCDYANLVRALPDYVFWKDRRSRYLGCNTAFAQLVGLTHPSEIIGLSDYDLPWQTPGHRAHFFQAGDQLAFRGQAVHNQLETLILPNAAPRLMVVSKQPLREANGLIYGVLGVARDKTVSRQLIASLEESLSQQADAQKSQQAFIANVSHSLRTPLAGIIGVLEAIGAQGQEAQTPLFALFQEASQQLLYHIEQLIALAECHQGKAVVEVPQRCQPRQILHQLHTLMQPLVKEKKLTFHLKISDSLPEQLLMTAHTFLSIALHLVSNAIQYTEKGAVTVCCRQTVHHLVLTVKDTGCGLSKQQQQHIVEPFTVVTPAYRRAAGGLGLGLALVQYALQAQGGQLSIDSEPDKGSCFTVYYPVETPVSPQAPLSTTSASSLGLSPFKPFKVLLIESDSLAALSTKQLFKRLSTHITVVDTLAAGQEQLDQTRFNLILLAINDAEKAAMAFARKVLTHQVTTPIVVLAEILSPALDKRCQSVGIQGTYQKPLQSDEVNALFHQYAPPGGASQTGARTPDGGVA